MYMYIFICIYIHMYICICIHIYAMYTYDIIGVITIRITIIHSQLQPDCRKPTHPNKLTTITG